MVFTEGFATGAIRCHIAGLTFEMGRGGGSTRTALRVKEHTFFAIRRFACLALWLGLPWTPWAEAVATPYQTAQPTEPENKSGRILLFDIPPQSLLPALRAYSDITGQAVLVDDALAEGRTSPGVHGVFDTTEALQALLTGTGLIASYSSDQAFTLKLAGHDDDAGETRQEHTANAVSEGTEAVMERYAGTIQHSIEATLCESAATRPGSYRLALQIWLARSGQIEKTRVLTPSDGNHRDRDVLHALHGMMLDPPPPDMPQPITLLLLPQRSRKQPVCARVSDATH